jgi:hypothetical protein
MLEGQEGVLPESGSAGIDAKGVDSAEDVQEDYGKLYEEKAKGIIAQLAGLSQQDVKNVLGLVESMLPHYFQIPLSLSPSKSDQNPVRL